jgi:transposase
MIRAEEAGVGHRVRRRRSVSEKLEIVRLTMEPGASVAELARSHGVNANQVFKWRRLFERGQLSDAGTTSTALLPVTISADAETRSESADAATGAQTSSGGAIHIELPGRANISVEGGADLALLRCILESLRK